MQVVAFFIFILYLFVFELADEEDVFVAEKLKTNFPTGVVSKCTGDCANRSLHSFH